MTSKQIIEVRLVDPTRIFWDRDPEHIDANPQAEPGSDLARFGAVDITGTQVHKVARTNRINQAIHRGTLESVTPLAENDAAALAAELGVAWESLYPGTGRHGFVGVADVRAAHAAAQAAELDSLKQTPEASKAAQKAAQAAGFDWTTIHPGSGANGSVTKTDVDKALAELADKDPAE